MRFFKYLFFLFFTFLINSAHSAVEYSVSGWGQWFPTQQSLCNYWYENTKSGYWNSRDLVITSYGCKFSHSNDSSVTINYITRGTPDECWHPDYKIVVQSIKQPIKKSICIPNNGVMCKYTNYNIANSPIVNDSITTTFSSVSKTPDPNCQEELVNPPCDPKDPYGGCYTPPNQECTRQFDGSILCPPDKEPPIQEGCNGADYCKRPPQGCGQGYVSGTFNGERICIKTKPSSGGGSGDGSGTGSGTGSGDGSGGADGADGADGKDVDSAGIIAAINKLRDSLIHYSKEIIESIDTMSKKITGKLDTSNGHLDQIEANTLDTKNNTDQTNNLLQQILDKTGTGGDGSGDPSTGDNVDLTETNDLLGQIRDGITDIKNVFSDDGKEELEQIGQPSNDSRFTSAEANAQSSLNNLANKLTFGSSSCVSDFQIQLPIFGSINIALSQWCSLLALIKILFQLVVLLTCLRMLDATVRTI